ncbi:MAG TPA: hypothetical protein VKT82_33775 [Ktedonobacterales bacterium]|nr:hypothetical protein [Ktedonobacterales bacterium]
MWRKLAAYHPGPLAEARTVRRLSLCGTGRSHVWLWLTLGVLALVLAACQPDTGGSASHIPTVQVPPNYQGSLRVTFNSSTTYNQAVDIVQEAGLQLVGPSCIGQGTRPAPGIPTPSSAPDEHHLFAQSHVLTAGWRVTQAQANKIAASPQVTALTLIHIPLCA